MKKPRWWATLDESTKDMMITTLLTWVSVAAGVFLCLFVQHAGSWLGR